MSRVVLKSSYFSNLAAAGGARLVSPSRRIINKQYAMNGSAYSNLEKRQHYLNKAMGGSPRDFPNHGGTKTSYYSVANGGILQPEDTAIWNGSLIRIAFTPPNARESEVVNLGISGEWWMERGTFMEIVNKVESPAELLEQLRAELALGYRLQMHTTRIISAHVKGPIAAYMGQGNVTSDRYDERFPILYGNPFLKQLFIPGIRDQENKADGTIIHSAFDVDATNTYDAVGVVAKFGSANGTIRR